MLRTLRLKGSGAPPLRKSRGMSSGKRRRERDEVAFGPLGRVGFGSSGGVELYCVGWFVLCCVVLCRVCV